MPSYLVHFNRLHDKKGRFTYGDGDGDGQRSDISKSARKNPGKSRDQNTGHHRYEKNNTYKRVRLDDGKVSRDWNDATRRGYGRALETGNSLAGNHERSFTNQHTGTMKSVPRNITSKFGPVTPKTPGIGDGSGRSKGDWSGNSSGSNYAGTSRGANMAPPPSNSSTASSELSDEMTDMLKKDQTKDNIRKKYEEAVEKGKDFVDKVFGGKETSTNAKSSDKYRKSDNAGKHGYDKRK